MMTSQPKNINQVLSQDLLWSIFNLNASDERHDMHKRLWDTLTSSHVCRHWRTMILESPSIWGKVIFVSSSDIVFEDSRDAFGQHQMFVSNPDLLYEVLKRSGSSPLRIHATGGTRSGYPLYEFLRHVFSNHWDRIQQLEVSMPSGQGEDLFDVEFLSLFFRPAPALRRCHINGPYGKGICPPGNPGIPMQISLFADAAPHIHTFRSEYLDISIHSSWLSNLTTFITTQKTAFSKDVGETLDALSRMQRLTYLELSHTLAGQVASIESISNFPVVELPFLKYMAIEGSALNCLALVDRIKRPSSDCVVNVHAHLNLEDTSVDRIILALYTQAFETTVQSMYAPSGIDWLYVDLPWRGIVLAEKGCFVDASPLSFGRMTSEGAYIFFVWKPWERFRDRKMYTSVIDSIFSRQALRSVKTLRLRVRPDADYTPLFSHFTSISTLEMNLDTLVALTSDNTSDEKDEALIPFPHMTTLRVADSPFCRHDGVTALKKFFKTRTTVAQSISTVELAFRGVDTTRIEEFGEVPDLATVVWEDELHHRVVRVFHSRD